MEHLNEDAFRKLAAGDGDAIAHFRGHLAQACERCEEFLAEHATAPALEALVDLALERLQPADPPLDELSFARLRRRMRRDRLRTPLAALAAMVLAVGSGALILPELLRAGGEQPVGIKGGPRLGLELSVASRRPDGGLVQLDPGAAASAADTLILRYHSTDVARAVLWKMDTAGPSSLGEFSLEPGTHDLKTDTGIAGIRLTGERGSVRFALVAAPPDTAPELLDRAAESGKSDDSGRYVVVQFEVRVED